MWQTSLISFALATAGAPLAKPSAAQTTAALSKPTLPAVGRQESILTVSKFGRYAITVTSPQGTALQLLDRIAGPGPIEGTLGKTDGRLDVFLDRGEHKILTHADKKGSGTAQLTVHSFTERNAVPPPLLVELKPVDATLNDFEQRSYWVEVRTRRQVIFEAAGRNLADLRLWANGEWLVDAAPATEVVMPEPGHPLLVCRLTTTLDPGFYLLTAYAGVGQPWAENSPQHPFYLRFGIPRLGQVGRSRHTLSPFGIDRYLVPGAATYFRVELPEARAATLGAGWFDAAHPFDLPSNTVHIEKTSLLPVAVRETEGILSDSDAREHLVTVSGAAGQPYVLQHFDQGQPYFCGGRMWPLTEAGTYWLSTVHSGDPTDSVDATALIIRTPRHGDEGPRIEPVAAQVIELGQGQRWARRCNLLDRLTVFIHILTTGKYEILSRGTEAKFRIEPFLVDPPEHYEAPELRGSGSVWDLDAGYYVLTAQPEKQGIIDIAVRPANQPNPTDAFADLSGNDLRAATQFPEQAIDFNYYYTMFLNEQPEVRAGLVVRMLPLDLTDPLPVIQKPGEVVSVRCKVSAAGGLHAEADDGTLLPVAVDGAAAQKSQTVQPGEHRLKIDYAGERQVHYTLAVEPLQLQASAPLPPLPDPSRAAPPKLRVLSDKEPQFFDLKRQAQATFLVRADTPALYRLESTGLLSTEGNLRTRTIPSVARAAENGVGHNFFVEQYLREGEYQVTVSAIGPSMGHLGLTLERTELVDGGALTPGVAAHIALPAGDAVAYSLVITDAGDYRLRSFGAGTTFRGRLEDADGWPIEVPNFNADLTRRFDPGTYRFISMPEPVAARRLTVFERIEEPAKREGHGPHTLPLAQRVVHVWMEPNAGAERQPDIWELTLPADVDATVDLTEEMQGTLVLVSDGQQPTLVATLPPGRGWKGKLQAGHYRVEATCARPDNRHAYEIAIHPEQLVDGLDREVTVPSRVPVSVGRDGLVQLSSFGATDVRARLYDNQERLIASSDDGPEDWNFQIQNRLRIGMYRLQIDPVTGSAPRALAAQPTPTPEGNSGEEQNQPGEGEALADSARAVTCRVSMRAPQEIVQSELSVPGKADAKLDSTVQLFPLSMPEHAGLLVVAARASQSVGLALETADSAAGGGWRTIGASTGRLARLEMLVGQSTRAYRLRLWSADGRGTAVHLDAVAVIPAPVSEQALAHGVTVTPVPGIEPRTGVVAVRLDRPGAFQLQGDTGSTRSCSVADIVCGPTLNDLVTASEAVLWLVSDLPSTPQKTTAARVLLPPGTDESLQFEVTAGRPVVCDLAEPRGGAVLAMATARSGQPGLGLIERGDAATAGSGSQGMAARIQSAAAVTLGAQQPAVVVWSASPGEPIAVRLQQLSFAQPVRESAAWGSWDAVLHGVSARVLDLPHGGKRLRLSLQSATVVALSERERVLSVHWQADEPFEETVEGSADRLTILHTQDGADSIHVDLLPLDAGAMVAPVALGVPYERTELRAGVLRLGVAAGENDAEHPRTLHVRTANPSEAALPVLTTTAGQVRRGIDVPLDADSGTLLVSHGPGLVLIWIDRRGEEARDLWGQAPLTAETTLGPPTIIPLAGLVQALRFSPPQPLMLHVRTSAPVVTLLQRGDTTPEVEVHPTGTILDAYLPEGPAQLGLRAIGAATLAGTAEVTVSPVTPIGEGLGPEVLLAAGGTHLFLFTVRQTGPVGIGVRAHPDVVDATLLDSSGKVLGRGVVQMPTLKAGTYLLALHAPPEVGPVPARPAVAGIELPSTSPPEDVVRGYMNLATAPEPTATASDGEGE